MSDELGVLPPIQLSHYYEVFDDTEEQPQSKEDVNAELRRRYPPETLRSAQDLLSLRAELRGTLSTSELGSYVRHVPKHLYEQSIKELITSFFKGCNQREAFALAQEFFPDTTLNFTTHQIKLRLERDLRDLIKTCKNHSGFLRVVKQRAPNIFKVRSRLNNMFNGSVVR